MKKIEWLVYVLSINAAVALVAMCCWIINAAFIWFDTHIPFTDEQKLWCVLILVGEMFAGALATLIVKSDKV